LAVGTRGDESEVRSAPGVAVLQEPGDRLPALVLVGLGRHRHPGVVGEKGDHALDVAALHCGGKPPEELALARRARQGCTLAAAVGHAFVERRTSPLQRRFDRGFAAVEQFGDFRGVEAQHVAQHEHGSQPWRQALQPGDEGERDRLARLVACVGAGSGVREPFEQDVGIWVQPERLGSARGFWWVDHADLLCATSAAAKRVQAAVGRDPVQPGS
jgi:hypothetical protein